MIQIAQKLYNERNNNFGSRQKPLTVSPQKLPVKVKKISAPIFITANQKRPDELTDEPKTSQPVKSFQLHLVNESIL